MFSQERKKGVSINSWLHCPLSVFLSIENKCLQRPSHQNHTGTKYIICNIAENNYFGPFFNLNNWGGQTKKICLFCVYLLYASY